MAKAIREYSLPELMERIEEIFNANPEPIKDFNGVVQYDVHGEETGTYQHFFKDGTLTIKEGVETHRMSPWPYHTIILRNFY
ncbi:hypothetical protein J7E81_06010 [Bacillus sp. ISL-18]|uniref:hypothetical protein n=1 Tax=Bacillus sp. ISL-18 TaxID=2819118 RepID=UPI001BE4E374|nr:hypothetical protein [Bacillus sp. ISL-18]MBT2654804.1 hypothetical protein [Bacillus sp. ISL-18]